jgi:DNA-binding response OmpR family regulator
VHPARDGEEAVRVACDRRPDAMVLDVEMPKLNGGARRTSAGSRTRAPSAARLDRHTDAPPSVGPTVCK